MLSIFTLFLWYSFAKTPLPGEKLPKAQQKIWAVLQKSWSKIQQKIWAKIPCALVAWFADKVARIQKNTLQKITLLTQVNTSLTSIIPLVKNTTIKSNLQTKQTAVQTMIKNYTTLKTTLEKNPQSTCWQKTPVWKSYNDQTKVLVSSIKTQIHLLKTTKK